MRSINKVIIIGNLTRNPEIRQTPNGQTVTTFGLATNREWVTKEGEKKNSAEFHECVAWAHLAEICQKYLKKGKLVYIEGYLKTRSWDTPEGIKKFKTEIVVQDMIMLEKKPSDEEYSHKKSTEQKENNEETTETTQDTEATETTENDDNNNESEENTAENPIDKDLGL